MESLNLHTLASSLPLAQQNAEKELANNFKAAALSITNLYRASRENSKTAYNHGYATACQDLLTMIQQGVSLNQAGSSHDAEGGGMTIGRVMDWIEARLEAIKSAEEEEEEYQEREKEKEELRQKNVASASARTSRPGITSQQPTIPTPSSPQSHPSEPSAALRPRASNRLRAAPTKVDLAPIQTTAPSLDTFGLSDTLLLPSNTSAGAKRRHAMMMLLDAGSATAPINGASTGAGIGNGSATSTTSTAQGSAPVAGNGRRRVRNSKAANPLVHSHAVNTVMVQPTSEAMDVEEEGGRERKRVARR